jgi:hypothetical protein
MREQCVQRRSKASGQGGRGLETAYSRRKYLVTAARNTFEEGTFKIFWPFFLSLLVSHLPAVDRYPWELRDEVDEAVRCRRGRVATLTTTSTTAAGITGCAGVKKGSG